MTSLQASLPDSASGLWRMDREYGVSSTRVKHIVIHEAHIRETPDRHVVYRVDVFTQDRNWCVYRRYSEFRRLHDRISERFRMFKGSFPPKQLSGNLSPEVIEQRRVALEHYLLKIVNCHNQEVSSCPSVLRFLDLQNNDVYFVTSALCRYVKNFGEAILNESHSFVVSPTQLFCLHKRLRIPNSDADYEADQVFCDLGALYDFIGRLNKVCIKPANQQDHGIRCDVSMLKATKELHIQTYSVSLLKGLSAIQLQIQRLRASQAVTAMKDVLIDCVLERKTQPKPNNRNTEGGESSWRGAFNSKAIFNSYTIHPWISLLYLDLSYNTIRQLDDSFSLLPNLQELTLSHNQIETLDLNYVNPSLTKLTCTHCHVSKVITKLHENLAELDLAHNSISDMPGFNKLVVLKRLSMAHNSLTDIDSIACLTELPRLQDIALTDNPLAKTTGYRQKVLCMFTQACRRTDIIVDGKGFSDKEKKKAKSTRVKGSTQHAPFTLPPFGSGSNQLPTTLDQPDDLWNSILHDNLEKSVSSEEAEVEEAAAVEGALSPTPSEYRSTPRSNPPLYDWDPAQAFASSASSSPAPGSGYREKTSSCGDDYEYVAAAVDENYSPAQHSPLGFNSSYYNIAVHDHSVELGQSAGSCASSGVEIRAPSTTVRVPTSVRAGRINPFGERASEGIREEGEEVKEEEGEEEEEEFRSCLDGEVGYSCSSSISAAQEVPSTSTDAISDSPPPAEEGISRPSTNYSTPAPPPEKEEGEGEREGEEGSQLLGQIPIAVEHRSISTTEEKRESLKRTPPQQQSSEIRESFVVNKPNLIEDALFSEAGSSLLLHSNEPVLPSNEPVLPSNEPVLSSNEPVLPSNEPVLPSNEPVLPRNEPVLSSNEPVLSSNEPVLSSNEPVLSSNEPVLPSNEPVLPSNDPLPPSNDSVLPSSDHLPPSNDPLPPSNDPLPPSNDPLPPSNDPVLPSNDSVLPSNDSVLPSNDAVLPSNDPVLPSNDLMLPSEEFFIPSNETMPPINEFLLPSNDPVIPSDETAMLPDTIILPNTSPITPRPTIPIPRPAAFSPPDTSASSGEEFLVRANRIESLSLTRGTELGGLYDTSDSESEETSAPLDFSSNRLVID